MPGHLRLNQIDRTEGTRGSETSKYPEEKKENSIPLVVASEEGRAQTKSSDLVVGLLYESKKIDA